MDLRNLTRRELAELLVGWGEPAYRGQQLFRWVHGLDVVDFAAMSNLGKPLRERLVGAGAVGGVAVDTVQTSRDGTRKLRLTTSDGRAIESVLIPEGDSALRDEDDEEEIASPHPPGFAPRRRKITQCISSQVGCALDCTFCATAQLGFGRQLTAGEIVDQVYRARALLSGLADDDPTVIAGAGSRRITNLVYMGMGEPLHNLKEVQRSIEILVDPHGLGLSPRRITVSTAGLVPAIAKFGASSVRVNLAVSLNATTDRVRDEIMPINRKWNLAALLDAVRALPLAKRQRVTFEYVLLDGVNDSSDDARRLPELLRGIPCKVNLIPWNPHPGAPYRRPTEAAVQRFQEELKARGLPAYLRRPRGDDIDAACGQLAGRGEAPPIALGRR